MQQSIARLCALGFSLLACYPHGVAQQTRPAITGISHMCVYASDLKASEDFYSRILGSAKAADPQDSSGSRFYFNATQFVEVLPLPAEHGLSRMACVGYTTPDVDGLRSYLAAKGVSPSEVSRMDDGARWFKTKDPEGNEVQFVQPAKQPAGAQHDVIGSRIIHVGYLVRNRKAEDHFYKDILGFKPYWFGAMVPDRTDWVSQQVPDGHDWLEYMLVGDGSSVALSRVDQRELGVLNHFSLGVPNMEEAVTTLIRGDRLSPRHDGPQMGKDGKWQANLYDPDGTRVELMEFHAVTKPCCSSFTAADPDPPTK